MRIVNHLPSHAEDGLDEALGAVRDGIVVIVFAEDSNAGPNHDFKRSGNISKFREFNMLVYTGWGGHLFRRFCNMSSESSTGYWAVLQLPCCPSKKGELSENLLQNLRNKWPPHPVVSQLSRFREFIKEALPKYGVSKKRT